MKDFIIWDDEIRAPEGIKPCPICGKSDGLIINMNSRSWYEMVKEHGGAVLTFKCKRCDLEMSEYNHMVGTTKYPEVKKALINKWNNRKEATV